MADTETLDVQKGWDALRAAVETRKASLDDLQKIATEYGLTITDPAVAQYWLDYASDPKNDLSKLQFTSLNPLSTSDVTILPPAPPAEDQTPSAFEAGEKAWADYWAKETPGLDPETLGLLGADFWNQKTPLSVLNAAILSVPSAATAGLETLSATGRAGAATLAQGLENVGLLSPLASVLNPDVKETPERFAGSLVDLINVGGLFAGAQPTLALPRVPRAAPSPAGIPQVSKIDELARSFPGFVRRKAAPVVEEVPASVEAPAPVSAIDELPAPVETPVPAPVAAEAPPAPRPAPAMAEVSPAQKAAPAYDPATGRLVIPASEQDIAKAVQVMERASTELPVIDPMTGQRAANLNLDKIETSDDVKGFLNIVAETNNDFVEARRGVMSIEDINGLASKEDLEDILTRKVGQALNAEQITAARRAVASGGEDIFSLANEYARTGDQNVRLRAVEAVIRQTALQNQLAGATAEAGRALRAMQEAVGPDRAKVVNTLVERLTDLNDPTKIDDFLTKVSTLNSPEQVAKMVSEASKPGFGDKITELWINSLLAGPTTHAVNITSNALTAFMQLPEELLASGIGRFTRSADRITLGEVDARAVGMMQGAKDGARLALQALKTGEAADSVRAVEQTRNAISGVKGEVVRIPSRLLTAEDELFKAISRRGEIAAQAYATAKREAGGDADAFKKLYNQYLQSPTKAMVKAAEKQASAMTFQTELGKYGKAAQSFTKTVWPARFVVPFLRTPANILKHAARRSPLAPISSQWRGMMKAGGRERDRALAQLTLGSSIAGTIYALAKNGQVTGNGPSDPGQRAALLATGWQPQSFKFGDNYISYGRIEPLAMTVGLAADHATIGDYLSDKENEDAATAVALSIAKNLASKTYLQGISDLMEAYSDPDRYAGNYIQKSITSFMPNVLAQTARSVDPMLRDTSAETFFGKLYNNAQSRIPFWSKDLPVKNDVWGDPITRTGVAQPSAGGVAYNLLSPVKVSEIDTSDPVKTEAARLQLSLGFPQKSITIRGESYKIPSDLYREYARIAGQWAKEEVAQYMTRPSYKFMDDEERKDIFRKIMTRSRAYARYKLNLKGKVLSGQER